MRLLSRLLLLFALLPLDTQAQSAPQVRPAKVEGTKLIVYKADGTEVSGEALVGAIIVGQGPEGVRDAFRIDKVEKDVSDPDGDIWLYTFSVKDTVSGLWQALCTPDPRGTSGGFPLSGRWSETGEHLRDVGFSIACTSGAIGKCLRFGYKPWSVAKKGVDMWDAHQSCVRMLRADYCGNGKGHTKDGTHIDIIDLKLGIFSEHSKELKFEAAWNSKGATCLARTRLGANSSWTLETVLKECPEKFKPNRQGPKACRSKAESMKPTVIFLNRS